MACVLSLIFGGLLYTSGIEVPVGENQTADTSNENITITSKEIVYEEFNPGITNYLALIFILIAVAFIYFEKKGQDDNQDIGDSKEW